MFTGGKHVFNAANLRPVEPCVALTTVRGFYEYAIPTSTQ